MPASLFHTIPALSGCPWGALMSFSSQAGIMKGICATFGLHPPRDTQGAQPSIQQHTFQKVAKHSVNWQI